eukprot:CAMPEP_0202974872 /NCGR_PEP_ID=MMETSP1396-20130829/64748_1 /ASSEMBLY_ACC=CAM_ASM_000872 /TAXON_ID= /ORGANISM="Pseudokeronopsis sp., Strain Brazil" /LENGTH=96 /DNA_ID=CAMNT_0049709537 /DNA_START=53 /DNA_END=340 /DNA_ORIENTATION=-
MKQIYRMCPGKPAVNIYSSKTAPTADQENPSSNFFREPMQSIDSIFEQMLRGMNQHSGEPSIDQFFGRNPFSQSQPPAFRRNPVVEDPASNDWNFD